MAGAVAVGLLLLSWRLGLLAVLLMRFARVYVGAYYYPGYVLAGRRVGAATVLVGCLAVVPPLTRIVTWLPDRIRTAPTAAR